MITYIFLPDSDFRLLHTPTPSIKAGLQNTLIKFSDFI
jgi:hypothetical protein